MIAILIGTMTANSLVAFAGTNESGVYEGITEEELLNFEKIVIDEENYTLKFEVSDDKTRSVSKIEYDAINEVMIVDGVSIELKTELISKPEEDTRNNEEILLEHKIRTFNEMKTKIQGNSRAVNIGAYIPPNAAYNKYTCKKTLGQIIGNTGSIAKIVTRLIGIVVFLSGIPYTAVKSAMDAICKGINVTTSFANGIFEGTWTYEQHVTKSQYKIGIITDYGYRYAHSRLDVNLKVGSKKGFTSKGHTTKGGWSTNRKPW